MNKKQLYPPIKPYVTHSLEVDGGHTLYIEESGNRNGLPVLFLHGGPGLGCSPLHRRFFDPDQYRIILFDQRGSGKSVPHAKLEHNTTWDLVEDIEKIRQLLKVDRWLVFGGSWGSTLSLIYAQSYPDRVLGLILRGIFLCRPQDIDWFYQYGASELYPDAWEQFVELIPEPKRDDFVKAYYELLTGEDEVSRMAAAKAWSAWEGSTVTLMYDQSLLKSFEDPFQALSLARIECHYFMNNSFLEPEQILRDAHKLKSIPGSIIHGRYDVVCPVGQAWALSKAWPAAKLEIIQDAGHYVTEPGILDALIRTTDKMARLLS